MTTSSTHDETSQGNRVQWRQPSARDPAAAYRRIAWLLILFVLLPSALLIVVGILLFFIQRSRDWDLVLGILVLLFCGLLATGTTLVWVFMAKEQNLSQLQTDFVSKVSHELKTPLTSIRLFVDTLKLRRAQNPELMDECLTLLARETERLTERIDQLLEWGRMEAGRRVYDLQLLNPSLITQEAIEQFEPLPLIPKAQIEFEANSAIPLALIDRNAWITAVHNLLSNATKYGGSPPHIRVRLKISHQGRKVSLYVTDNGDGIPKSEHKRIFQKFYRRDDRFSRTTEGSGLGLAIVAHIVRGHRGRIHVESEVGHGATFCIEIPAVHQPNGNAENTHEMKNAK